MEEKREILNQYIGATKEMYDFLQELSGGTILDEFTREKYINLIGELEKSKNAWRDLI
jgi:hypothetical protein